MIKNHGPILIADIGSLAIQRGGIVIRPENIQQLIVTHDSRIEFHLHNFGVTGRMTAHIFVSGVLGFAAGVTDQGLFHTRNRAKSRFHAPETSRTKSCLFRRHPAASNEKTVRARCALTLNESFRRASGVGVDLGKFFH